MKSLVRRPLSRSYIQNDESMITHHSSATARDFLSTVAAEKASIWCEICVAVSVFLGFSSVSISVFLSVSSVSVSVSFICLCIEESRVQSPAHAIIEGVQAVVFSSSASCTVLINFTKSLN